MSAQIIDGRAAAEKIRALLKSRIEKLKSAPNLAVILVGMDERSLAYIRQKQKAASGIGAEVSLVELPETISQEELETKIRQINTDKEVDGIIVQLPLPRKLDSQKAISKIDKVKDVDGLLPDSPYKQATPAGIFKLLKEYKVEVKGKTVVVLGSSGFVGAPLVTMLKEAGANVVEIDENTPQPYDSLVQQGDIIIAAVGKAKLVTADMVKDNAVVIDVGTNVNSEGKLVGDVDFEAVAEKASLITPVPGGVGPMTVAMLLSNLVSAAELSQ